MLAPGEHPRDKESPGGALCTLDLGSGWCDASRDWRAERRTKLSQMGESLLMGWWLPLAGAFAAVTSSGWTARSRTGRSSQRRRRGALQTIRKEASRSAMQNTTSPRESRAQLTSTCTPILSTTLVPHRHCVTWPTSCPQQDMSSLVHVPEIKAYFGGKRFFPVGRLDKVGCPACSSRLCRRIPAKGYATGRPRACLSIFRRRSNRNP